MIRRRSPVGIHDPGMLEEKPTKDLQDDVTVESAFEDMLIAKAKLTECTINDYAMLRNRWDEAREKAAAKAAAEGDATLTAAIRQFQFRDIRPKAASEIDDISHASRLLGHSTQEMTKKVYRRVGEIVRPTK